MVLYTKLRDGSRWVENIFKKSEIFTGNARIFIMIGRLAERVCRVGGFSFICADYLNSATGRHANALKRALLEMPPTRPTHTVVRCQGWLGSLGKLNETRNQNQISFPGTIFIDDAETSGKGHLHVLSINGFLMRPKVGINRSVETFRDDVLWNPPPPQPEPPARTLLQRLFTKEPPPPPQPQGSLRTFREVNPKAGIDEQAMYVFWSTGTNEQMTGSNAGMIAAFLLPASDAMDLMRTIEEDPNNFHKLFADLWPGYALIHPLLNLGKAEFQRVVNPSAGWNEEIHLKITKKRFAIQRKTYIPALSP